MLTTRVWYSEGMNYTWPEQQAGVTPNLGICFPGGGTRALCATMGQLRGLLSFDFLNNVDYISCVSGGSWASTGFAFYRAGAANDTELLGTILDPNQITLDNIHDVPPSSLGWGATQDLGEAIDAAHNAGVPEDLLWAAAVGQVFFARFGLYDPKNPAYFSLDDATVQAIKAANPSLANATFHTVRTPASYKVPYLLINATIDGPTKTAPYNPDPLVMITYSPLYAGIPFQQTVKYPLPKARAINATVDALVGGGFIEPFAWGSDAPAAPAANGTVQVPPPKNPFEVVNASGTSSSAFAAAFEKIKLIDKLLPEQNYWPPVASGAQLPAQDFDFGDGGNLENYGLIPLLMRGVKKIILFINTETPLDTKYDPSKPPYQSDLDSNFPPLFGVKVNHGDTVEAVNQVFPTGDYAPIIRAFQAQKNAGQPMIQTATHQIVANPWWGIPGGGSVEMLYVYLDKVDAWKNLLTDEGLKIQLDLGDIGEFPHFPNYKTIDENVIPPWGLTKLTQRQVNLLAALTCWVVRQNETTFKAFV